MENFSHLRQTMNDGHKYQCTWKISRFYDLTLQILLLSALESCEDGDKHLQDFDFSQFGKRFVFFRYRVGVKFLSIFPSGSNFGAIFLLAGDL